MTKKSKFRFKAIEVTWVDSEQHADWNKLSDILEDQGTLECKSVGFLIEDKPDRVILASSISSDENYEECVSYYITIPRVAISSIKELKYKAPAKKKKIGIQEQQ